MGFNSGFKGLNSYMFQNLLVHHTEYTNGCHMKQLLNKFWSVAHVEELVGFFHAD